MVDIEAIKKKLASSADDGGKKLGFTIPDKFKHVAPEITKAIYDDVKDVVKEVVKEGMKAKILREYNNIESNIPVNHKYWHLSAND